MLKYLAFVLAFACVLATALAAPPPTLPTTLDGLVSAACARPQWKQASVGVVVQSLKDGTTWYARNAATPFIPASTAKVVTAAMALEYFRPIFVSPHACSPMAA